MQLKQNKLAYLFFMTTKLTTAHASNKAPVLKIGRQYQISGNKKPNYESWALISSDSA